MNNPKKFNTNIGLESYDEAGTFDPIKVPDLKPYLDANRAVVEQGIIMLTDDNTVFKFANGKKIMTIPFDQHPYGALAQYFKTDDGVDLMKSLTKKLA